MKAITKDALVKRINRKLGKSGARISATATTPWGTRAYHVENTDPRDVPGAIIGTVSDLELFGRVLGVIRQGEQIAA